MGAPDSAVEVHDSCCVFEGIEFLLEDLTIIQEMDDSWFALTWIMRHSSTTGAGEVGLNDAVLVKILSFLHDAASLPFQPIVRRDLHTHSNDEEEIIVFKRH